ncbi:nitrate/nitrite transporter NarK [Hoeflea halophila]|uniref:Nitrate/nitrite transporter NarK n=1 Tax=Hoeflea halophila TaxID=714899 RepID=A0A286HPY4_9HYPH|nr:MFS transporter [Hoeflea halophila]SOE09855.1 nitrate/nitrite transporter NarK [Hoeflea halophila]
MTYLTRSPLFLVLVLWGAGLGAAAQFARIVVIFPELQAHYGQTGAASGYLVSLISFVGMVLGLVAGVIAMQVGLRRLLITGLTLGAVISGWQSTMPGFEAMMLSRLFEGLSHLAIVVSAPTLISQFATQRHQGAALTLWGTFFGVAFAVVALSAPPLVAAHGLGSLAFVHALYMAGFALLASLVIPTHDRTAVPAWPSLGEILRRHLTVYASPFIAAPALGWLFYTLTFVSLLTILPTMIDPSQRAMVTAAMPLASIASSLTLGNWLLRHFKAIQVIIIGFSLAICLALALIALGVNAWLAIAIFASLGLVQGASFAAVPQLNPGLPERTLANGGLAQMGNIGNGLGTPTALAILSLGSGVGLPLFLILSYAAAIATHLLLGRLRKAGIRA